MAQVFISYSRRDSDFVRKLGDALAVQKREAWVDWKDIPLTAEWQQEILTNIEAADNFIFVVSPESKASPNCRKEIDHAVANHKRMVPIFYRAVPDGAIPEALSKFQRIDFSNKHDFDAKFAALSTALDVDLPWVQAHTRLMTRAKEWEREGKDNSFLLHGKDLREAEQWVAKSPEKEPKPTTLHSQYILASRHSATKRQRIIIGAVTVAFLIAVGLAIYAFGQRNIAQLEIKEAEHQRNVAEANAAEAQKQKKIAEDNAAEATRQKNTAISNEAEAKRQEGIAKEETATAQRNQRESRARELAAFSTESLKEDPERSILLGMHAVNATLRFGQHPVPAAEEALHQAILSSPVRMTLGGHRFSVSSVAWSPDGKRLATGSSDKTAKIWDAATGKELLTLSHGSGVNGVAWSPDGNRLATGSGNRLLESLTRKGAGENDARVWEAATGKKLLTLARGIDVSSVAWSPDGKRLATASGDKAVKVWDGTTGKELLTLAGNGYIVSSVAWSPDSKRLATASGDNTARVWDGATGKELLTLAGHSDIVSSVAWSQDGQRLATGSWDKTAKVWDGATGKELLTLSGHIDHVYSVAWSPDGQRLATGSGNYLQDYSTKKGDENDNARVWEAASGKELLTLSVHRGSVYSVAWSPDGQRLATGSWDKTADVWEAATGKELLTLSGHTALEIESVAWSPDGQRLATGCWDKTAKIWDAATGKEMRSLSHGGLVNSVAWSPDGKRLATASGEKTAKLWDWAKGKELLTLSGHSNVVESVAWSPNGKRLATASWDGTAKVWEAASGKKLLTLRGHSDRVESVAWSPDGKRLATASGDKTARVWEAATGKELLTLSGHGDRVESVAWSPDGNRLASGSRDHTAKLWDGTTGKNLLTLSGHSSNVASVAWSPDGKRLATTRLRRDRPGLRGRY